MKTLLLVPVSAFIELNVTLQLSSWCTSLLGFIGDEWRCQVSFPKGKSVPCPVGNCRAEGWKQSGLTLEWPSAKHACLPLSHECRLLSFMCRPIPLCWLLWMNVSLTQKSSCSRGTFALSRPLWPPGRCIWAGSSCPVYACRGFWCKSSQSPGRGAQSPTGGWRERERERERARERESERARERERERAWRGGGYTNYYYRPCLLLAWRK